MGWISIYMQTEGDHNSSKQKREIKNTGKQTIIEGQKVPKMGETM